MLITYILIITLTVLSVRKIISKQQSKIPNPPPKVTDRVRKNDVSALKFLLLASVVYVIARNVDSLYEIGYVIATLIFTVSSSVTLGLMNTVPKQYKVKRNYFNSNSLIVPIIVSILILLVETNTLQIKSGYLISLSVGILVGPVFNVKYWFDEAYPNIVNEIIWDFISAFVINISLLITFSTVSLFLGLFGLNKSLVISTCVLIWLLLISLIFHGRMFFMKGQEESEEFSQEFLEPREIKNDVGTIIYYGPISRFVTLGYILTLGIFLYATGCFLPSGPLFISTYEAITSAHSLYELFSAYVQEWALLCFLGTLLGSILNYLEKHIVQPYFTY